MAASDPWAHRSAGMKCKTCMWWAPKPATENEQGQAPVRILGRCRRHAPTMNGFPACWSDDWCGDHKLDETKV